MFILVIWLNYILSTTLIENAHIERCNSISIHNKNHIKDVARTNCEDKTPNASIVNVNIQFYNRLSPLEKIRRDINMDEAQPGSSKTLELSTFKYTKYKTHSHKYIGCPYIYQKRIGCQTQMLGPLNSILYDFVGQENTITEQKFKELRSHYNRNDDKLVLILQNDISCFVDITSSILNNLCNYLELKYNPVISNSYENFIDSLLFRITKNQTIVDAMSADTKVLQENENTKRVDDLMNPVKDIIMRYFDTYRLSQILSELNTTVNAIIRDIDLRTLLLMMLREYGKVRSKPFEITSVVAFISLEYLSNSRSIYIIKEVEKKQILCKIVCILNAYSSLRNLLLTYKLDNFISRLVDSIIYRSILSRCGTRYNKNVLKVRATILDRNAYSNFKEMITLQNSNFMIYFFGLHSKLIKAYIYDSDLSYIPHIDDRYMGIALMRQAFKTFNNIIEAISLNLVFVNAAVDIS